MPFNVHPLSHPDDIGSVSIHNNVYEDCLALIENEESRIWATNRHQDLYRYQRCGFPEAMLMVANGGTFKSYLLETDPDNFHFVHPAKLLQFDDKVL